MATNITLEQYVNNIRKYAAMASAEQIHDGLAWYKTARDIAATIARKTEQSLENVAAIIAALSPQNRWNQNIIDADRLCTYAQLGETEPPKVSTFHANKYKAWTIANGGNWREVLIGPKVESFVANILGDYNRVTVDIWAIRAASDFALMSMPKGQYRIVERAYQIVASELGYSAADLQAIVWTVVRELGTK